MQIKITTMHTFILWNNKQTNIRILNLNLLNACQNNDKTFKSLGLSTEVKEN